MLLILEIALTISAWRKGWKAKALLPLPIAFGVLFLIGIAAAATGSPLSEGSMVVVGLLFDLASVGVLSYLAKVSPQEHQARTTREAAPAPGQVEVDPAPVV